MTKQVLRGEIYYAHLSPVQGSEQGGVRPVLIIQNNVGNKHAPTTIVAPLTTKLGKKKLPTHIEIEANEKLELSMVLCEQIRVIDKGRLSDRLCAVSEETMALVDKTIKISLGLV